MWAVENRKGTAFGPRVVVAHPCSVSERASKCPQENISTHSRPRSTWPLGTSQSRTWFLEVALCPQLQNRAHFSKSQQTTASQGEVRLGAHKTPSSAFPYPWQLSCISNLLLVNSASSTTEFSHTNYRQGFHTDPQPPRLLDLCRNGRHPRLMESVF